jgi:predicted phage tail component-like protein
MTFNGTTSQDMNITVIEVRRPLLPQLTKNTVKVPGKHGEVDLGENTYENKIIEVDIGLAEETEAARLIKARQAAKWISQKGALCFSDEPDIHYIGRIYSSVPLETFLTLGKATLIFDCEPFGYQDKVTEQVVTNNNQNITVINNGAEETPMRIKLKNTGTTTINQITLMKFRT